ncbi:MAG: sulfatase [Mangrovibacterium sp.]
MNRLTLTLGTLIVGTGSLFAKQKQPNLVFIFSDQQSYDMLGCYGNKDIKTPVIDQLAREGVRFNYCISSQPVCCPMRGMLMTGQHPLYNGVYTNDVKIITGNGATFGQTLKNAGYQTGYIGKWHLYGGNRNRPIPPGADRLGFDVFHSNNCTVDFRAEKAFYFNEKGEKVYFGEWEVYGQTDQATDFLRDADKNKPFALFVSYHAPHDQGRTRREGLRYESISGLMDRYDPDSIALRPNAEEISGRNDSGENLNDLREDYHGYYAMCTGIDEAVGNIIRTLKETDRLDNTIIVYTSDHGDNLYSHGRPWAKGTPEDESVRVPLIVKWSQNIKPEQTSNLLIGTLDLMPTILGLMNIHIPETCQGKDLSGDILGDARTPVKSVPLFFFEPNWRGVFTERYTFAFDLYEEKGDQSWNVLYDRNIDPYQQHNLFYKPEYREVRDKMFKMTLSWLKRFNDPVVSEGDLSGICGFRGAKMLCEECTGELPGRPVDLLHEANLPSRIPLKMPGPDEERVLLERIRNREINQIEGLYKEKKEMLIR